MKYEYLEDGTPFVALELNNRINSAATHLNNLDESSLSWGALRHEHLPMLIGRSGQSLSEENTQFQTRIGKSFDPADTSSVIYGVDVGSIRTRLPLTVHYRTGEEINMTADNVSAFIVLFNANVRKFIYGATAAYLDDLNPEDRLEDFLSAKFTVVFEDSTGRTAVQGQSARAISPGYVMAGIDIAASETAGKHYNYKGQALRPDNATNKDVAIRTVVLPADIATLNDVKNIYVVCNSRALGAGSASKLPYSVIVEVTKMNLTVIPIQAEVR